MLSNSATSQNSENCQDLVNYFQICAMETYELIIIIVIVFLLILWGDKQRQYFLANEFTGPTAYPLIGNIVQLWDANKNNYVDKMDKLVKKYGNLFRLFLGPYLMIVVTDPKHIEVILKSGNVNKPAIYKLMELVTSGIIIASGEKWKTLRRILNSSFQTISMENYVKLFNENGKVLCEILDKNADGGVFDIEKRIQNFTFDSTCRTLMSSNFDIQHKSTIMIDLAKKVTLTFVYRLTHIWLIPTCIFKRTRMGKELKVCSKQAEEFVNTIIQNRRDVHNKKEKISDEENEILKHENGNVHTPYIDNIMNYAKSENLTDRDLCYLVFDILGAGFETSTVAICHTIMMLAIHQNIQEKVHDELTEMFGNSDRDITMEDLDNMKLLQRVILESIRIAGITQMLRSVEKDIKLDCCTIPQGSTVFVPFYTLHNDKKYWSNPDEFYPDHFLPENVEKRPKFSFIPFSYGPRNCPGNKFSICQIKMSLVYILRRYRIHTDMKFSDLQYIALFMRKSPTGYPIKLLKRELSNGKSYNCNGKSYNCNGKSYNYNGKS